MATELSILVNGSQDRWKGRATEVVRATLGNAGTLSDQIGEAFVRTSNAIVQQRDAAVQVNKAMPEPVGYSPMDIMKKWAGPAIVSLVIGRRSQLLPAAQAIAEAGVTG